MMLISYPVYTQDDQNKLSMSVLLACSVSNVGGTVVPESIDHVAEGSYRRSWCLAKENQARPQERMLEVEVIYSALLMLLNRFSS